ncbi:MAG: hypothetical protein OIF34_08865, partial [Porticoccaceae bacterium]|nr:hypothetical protein [Porticoccaceae bacterium]
MAQFKGKEIVLNGERYLAAQAATFDFFGHDSLKTQLTVGFRPVGVAKVPEGKPGRRPVGH